VIPYFRGDACHFVENNLISPNHFN